MSSRAEAELAVKRIGKRYGYLDERMLSDIERLHPGYRREIEEAMLAKDQLAGQSITTLAKEIYGSQARFIFELLQNADDNRFQRAKSMGHLPSLSFWVHHDRIVIECNEDGFTPEDLEAICAVGKSTKSTSSAYIGAKGIGFKSVFIAASNVSIQSGHFSFSFKHKKGDSGLGMVLPIWNDDPEELSGPLTRTTLLLHQQGDPAELQSLRNTILTQFADLQESCLLFLKNIKVIQSVIYADEQSCKIQSKRTMRADADGLTRRWLESVDLAPDGSTTTTKKYYHVTTHMAKGLPKSESRESPDDSMAAAALTTAKVILAFPLTASSKPIIQNQDIFVFLPVRESGFKFLIQSDFDTSANRQDVSTTSRRNLQLRKEIAHAFIKAVLEFCDQDGLSFTWPKYLPQPSDTLDNFWSALRTHLMELLKTTPVLRSRQRSELRRTTDVVALTYDFKDNKGQPLLDDFSYDRFLAEGYSWKIFKLLEPYGLDRLDFGICVELLEYDLNTLQPRMRTTDDDDEAWHTAVSKIFSRILETKEYSDRFSRLQLLPLRDGTWTSVRLGPVYFPDCEGINIPAKTDLSILRTSAARNAARRKLFELLGAVEANVSCVRASLLRQYGGRSSAWTKTFLSLPESKEHLKYLYLTHESRERQESPRQIQIYTSDVFPLLRTPHMEKVFLPSSHPLGPQALLRSSEQESEFTFLEIHGDYLTDVPDSTLASHPTWKSWLIDYLHLRDKLSVMSDDGNELSAEWHYVHRHHPEKLLHLLEHLWKFEGSRLRKAQNIRDQISLTRSRELFVSNFGMERAVRYGWLPISSHKQQVEHFMGSAAQFPFLDVASDETDEQLARKWRFLQTDFEVRQDTHTSFLLSILFHLPRQCAKTNALPDARKVLELYLSIAAAQMSAADQNGAQSKILAYFSSKKIILSSIENVENSNLKEWRSAADCLWEGPIYFSSRAVLKSRYMPYLSQQHMLMLSIFFTETLRIPNATQENIIVELEFLRDHETDSLTIERMASLYTYLTHMPLTPADSRAIRAEFEAEALIYSCNKGASRWYKSTDCIWASSTDIRGKVTLSEQYDELETFFITTLGVKKLTLRMVYDQLVNKDLKADVSEIKSMIWALNSMIQAEGSFYQDPAQILASSIFPVAYPSGSIELRTASTEFAVNDRQPLTDLFQDQITLLDFNLEESRRLRPFLEWTGLTDRYLSVSVRELTSISGDDARPTASRKYDLKRKAHGLLRIAATFNSARCQDDPSALYALLRTTEVMETDHVSTFLRVYQGGKMIEVRRDASGHHIEEREGRLKIYVPAERKARELCFTSQLPVNLAEWLMRDPRTQIPGSVDSTAVTALTMLFTVGPSNVASVLESQGIIRIDITNEDGHESDEEEEREIGTARAERNESPSITLGSSYSPQPTTSLRLASLRSLPAYDHSLRTVDANVATEDLRYERLLDRVINAAQNASFPSKGSFDMSSLRTALVRYSDYRSFDGTDDESMVRGFRSANQLERDMKVGAAGELYVFELFSALSPALTGWGRANWESRIRRFVSVHPRYRNLEPWNGTETADLTYNDVQGELTPLLIECGYLREEEWSGARPQYFLEVKTTTGPAQNAFYMSKHQYRRMQGIHQRRDRSQIYVVLRVFDLEGPEIGMKIYVDPEKLRQDASLQFTSEQWSVVPA